MLSRCLLFGLLLAARAGVAVQAPAYGTITVGPPPAHGGNAADATDELAALLAEDTDAPPPPTPPPGPAPTPGPAAPKQKARSTIAGAAAAAPAAQPGPAATPAAEAAAQPSGPAGTAAAAEDPVAAALLEALKSGTATAKDALSVSKLLIQRAQAKAAAASKHDRAEAGDLVVAAVGGAAALYMMSTLTGNFGRYARLVGAGVVVALAAAWLSGGLL